MSSEKKEKKALRRQSSRERAERAGQRAIGSPPDPDALAARGDAKMHPRATPRPRIGSRPRPA